MVTQKERIMKIEIDVGYIRRALDGNGKKGVIQQVTENTKWRLLITGGLILLSTLVGWGLFK